MGFKLAHLRDVDFYYEQWASCGPIDQEAGSQGAIKKTRAMNRIQQSLIAAQELGDEKLQIVTQLQELIDHKTRQLEHDFSNLDYGKDDTHMDTTPSNGSFYAANANHHHSAASNHTSHSNSPSAIASPIHASATPLSSFHAAPAATITTSSATGGGSSLATSERYNSTSSGNGSKDTGERSSKRPRRARNDNGSAHSGEATGSGDNSTSAADNIHTKTSAVSGALLSTSVTSAGSANSTPATKKNNNSSISSGLAAASSTVGASGNPSAAAANASAGGAASRKKQKRKSGRAGQTVTAAASSGSTATAGTQAASLAAAAAARDRDATPPQEEAIDPDEPTYCLCDQISFGEMILCDNDLCPIEWFHFSCVSLLSKPKGKWFCPNCRGDRPNVMKPKAQFLKELERYNKEKEEKT